MRFVLLLVVCAVTQISCSTVPSSTPESAAPKRVLMFGGSGRIGGHIVREALDRGYRVTAVSRDPARIETQHEDLTVVQGDILDRERVRELVSQHDAVLVSVGGRPTSSDPQHYIAATAAESLIDVLEPLGPGGPRMIFVGNLFTLIYQDGKTLLELGRVDETHPNLRMFQGHQIALDRFRASDNVQWTVASPPNGLRLKGKTGDIVWGEDAVLRNQDGVPLTISPEDFAYAVIEELEAARYVRRRFTVGRKE